MTTPTFSINSASEILERDRRTLVKALRHTPPDGKMRGAPRWRLKTILDALEEMQPARPTPVGQIDPRLASLYAQFEVAETAMSKKPTLAARRQAACEMLPLIVGMDKATRKIGIASGQDSELVHLRADQLLRLYARSIEGPCEWTHDQVWKMILEAEDA
jgi:RNase H-fold protein (predicted Holliday junction resolvase)